MKMKKMFKKFYPIGREYLNKTKAKSKKHLQKKPRLLMYAQRMESLKILNRLHLNQERLLGTVTLFPSLRKKRKKLLRKLIKFKITK